jgi:nitrite reductase/ring-hydroxylating ferredoxin subunit
VNPARPEAGRDLCALDEVPEPGAKGFRFRQGDAMFAGFVIRKDGAVLGYEDSCPHAGWPLGMFDAYLTRENDYILCRGHGALFRPLDGHCVSGPCAGDNLNPWPVEVRGGRLVTA